MPTTKIKKFAGMIILAFTMSLFVQLYFADTNAWSADYSVIVDEHDTPLPAPSPAGWYYNATGGDRGKLKEEDISYSLSGTSAYTATVSHVTGAWTYGGMWYNLIRVDADNIPLDFQNIFGPYIKPEYQGRITELEIVVNSVSSPSSNGDLSLKVELKNESDVAVYTQSFANLISQTYPKTFTIALNPPSINNVEQILWVMDQAQLGDSITVDKVRLKASVPDLTVVSSQEQAFLWTYSWLMRNYNPATGMVNDKSRDGEGDMEAVTATAKAAKVTYYAYRKGYITLADAQTIITKIADTLINIVPRGPSGVNSLWPHFTENGGTAAVPPRYGFSGTEWSSGDTIYAALDMITALEMIGDPQTQIPSFQNFLTAITWADLVSPQGYIGHGYSYEGTKLTSYWQGFGMETIGVDWAYASATGNLANMEIPPSDNGSGFIDNAHYPMVFSGTDRWGNDWDAYRNNMANTQIGYYNGLNNYLYGAGLFGLSAAENPEIHLDPSVKYLAYGTGGKGSPVDGEGEVVVLHYSGMIADKKPTEAIHMWEVLRDRTPAFLQNKIVLSPLNNMESMKVDKETGIVLAVNYLKGSWNLALQAEGWAMTDPAVKADLNAAVQNNAFLKQGYELLKTHVLRVPQDYGTIQDAIDAAVSGDTIMVAAGTYAETLTLNKSGITLQGANWASIIQGVSGYPVIDCSGISGSETKIKGFTITNGSYGIRCAGDVTSLRIENNYIASNGITGIVMENGASVVIKDNSIYNCWRGISGNGNNTVDIINNNITWNRGSYGGGIILANATTLIKDNYFFENWDGAINLSSNCNATITSNKIYRNSSWNQAAGLNIDDSTVTLWNNLIQDVRVNNSQVVGAGLNARRSSISAFNNVFRNNSSGRGAAINVSDTNFVCKNNIFNGNTSAQETVLFAGTGTQDFSYNDMFGNTTAANTTGITLGPGNITADPLFLNTVDFYLGSGSPCVDAGDPAPQYNDLNLTRNDMGIYGGPYGERLDYTLNMTEMNWYENVAPYSSTGAATCQMILNYIRQGAGQPTLTQNEIYEYGRSPLSFNGTELNPAQMDKALGYYYPYDYLVSNWADYFDSQADGNPYQGYNYTIDTYDPVNNLNALGDYLRDICHWMAYTVTKEDWWRDGELVARPHTPATVPIYGLYNWVAVKGCVTSVNPAPTPHTNPWNTPDFTVYGLWMKDPRATGIGQDTYKTAAECTSTYFKPLVTNDEYDGLYLQVAEPAHSHSDAHIEVEKPKEDIENLYFVGVEPLVVNIQNAQSLKQSIKKQSWRDLVEKHLLTDNEAVQAFDNSKMGKPILVERTDTADGDYYLVPFGKNVRGNFLASGVIILDANDGHFKEASWTKAPEKFPKIDRTRAAQLIKNKIFADFLNELKSIPKKPVSRYAARVRSAINKYQSRVRYISRTNSQLIWEPGDYSSSPYKPYWKFDLNSEIWIVTQEGQIIKE